MSNPYFKNIKNGTEVYRNVLANKVGRYPTISKTAMKKLLEGKTGKQLDSALYSGW